MEAFPAEIVTDVGAITDLLFVDTVTTVPPMGAGPLSDTVPIAVSPPATELLANDRLVSNGGEIVKWVVTFDAPELAVIVTTVDAGTGVVEIGNVAVVALGGNVTLCGTRALNEFVERATVRAEVLESASVTVPVLVVPPTTVGLLREIPPIA